MEEPNTMVMFLACSRSDADTRAETLPNTGRLVTRRGTLRYRTSAIDGWPMTVAIPATANTNIRGATEAAGKYGQLPVRGGSMSLNCAGRSRRGPGECRLLTLYRSWLRFTLS
jgi:hypothetical protein